MKGTMKKSYLLIYTNPMPGREAEYNDWYNNVHLKEVCAVPGFISAQRFKLDPVQMHQDQNHRYLAIYEIEHGQEEQALENLLKAAPSFQNPGCADLENGHSMVVSTISDLVLSSSRP